MLDIEALTRQCDQHERTIRTTRSTIDHRMDELDAMIERFQQVDAEAEATIHRLHAIAKETTPLVSDSLDSHIAKSAVSVTTHRERSEPWAEHETRGMQGFEAIKKQVDVWLQAEIMMLNQEKAAKADRRRDKKYSALCFLILAVAFAIYYYTR